MKNTLPALICLIAASAVTPSPVKATTAISTLGSATATNIFDNGSFEQGWSWNSLSNGNGLLLSTNSTVGTGGNFLLDVEMTGANSNSNVTTYAINAYDEHTGTNSTNYGITGTAANGTQNYGVQGKLDPSFGGNAGDAAVWGNAAQSTGATYGIYGTNVSSTGYAGYFNNSGGGYAAAFMGGNVGIGTATPQSLLQIYGGEVQVGSSGASCAAANNGAIRFSGSTLYYCTGTTWTSIGSGGGSQWTTSGSNIYYSTGNVGIGTATIANKLDINGAASIGYADQAAPSNGLLVSGSLLGGDTSNWVFGGQIYANGGSGNGIVGYAAANGQAAIVSSVKVTGANLMYFAYQPNGPQSTSGYVAVGNITTNGSDITIGYMSDKRLKENVKPVANSGEIIDAMEPVTYDWKYSPNHTKGVGFLAQDLYKVFPNAVSVGDSGSVDSNGHVEKPWGVDYSKPMPVVIAELKSLRARLAADEATIVALKAKLGM
jgi:hypothetical protein